MRISDWSSDVCSSDLISVTANVAPRLMHEMCMAALAGNAVLTRTLNARLATLNKVLFVEANPIPVKWAVAQMGLSKLGYRLPLTSLHEQHHALVRNSLKDAGLIKMINMRINKRCAGITLGLGMLLLSGCFTWNKIIAEDRRVW